MQTILRVFGPTLNKAPLISEMSARLKQAAPRITSRHALSTASHNTDQKAYIYSLCSQVLKSMSDLQSPACQHLMVQFS